MTEDALKQTIRGFKGSLRNKAKRLEVSPAYLSDVLADKRGIGPKLAAALGYKLTIRSMRSFERIK